MLSRRLLVFEQLQGVAAAFCMRDGVRHRQGFGTAQLCGGRTTAEISTVLGEWCHVAHDTMAGPMCQVQTYPSACVEGVYELLRIAHRHMSWNWADSIRCTLVRGAASRRLAAVSLRASQPASRGSHWRHTSRQQCSHDSAQGRPAAVGPSCSVIASATCCCTTIYGCPNLYIRFRSVVCSSDAICTCIHICARHLHEHASVAMLLWIPILNPSLCYYKSVRAFRQ